MFFPNRLNDVENRKDVTQLSQKLDHDYFDDLPKGTLNIVIVKVHGVSNYQRVEGIVTTIKTVVEDVTKDKRSEVKSITEDTRDLSVNKVKLDDSLFLVVQFIYFLHLLEFKNYGWKRLDFIKPNLRCLLKVEWLIYFHPSSYVSFVMHET